MRARYARPVRLALLLTSVVVLSLAACGDDDSKSGSAASGSEAGLGGRSLKVSHDVAFPPFEFQKSGRYVGFDLDLINAVANLANFKPRLSPMDFDGIIPALQAHQTDMAVAAMTIKPERQKVIDFSTPYFKTGIRLAVTPGTSNITTPEDLKGKRVAVKVGASGESFIRGLKFAKDIDIKTFNTNGDTYLAVQNGNVDATVNDDSTLRYYIAGAGKGKLKTVGELLTGDTYGIAIPKGNGDIVKAVNDALLKLAADGTYARLYRKWFDAAPTAVPGKI
jgi:ABC-type amino acid transport substrate-binding protein